MGIRTACHAFDSKGKFPQGHAEWVKFDPEVIGGHYTGHYPAGIVATIEAAAFRDGKSHTVLTGIKTPFQSQGSLYKTNPLAGSAMPLLIGSIPDQKAEPVAWLDTTGKAKVFSHRWGAKRISTAHSLGSSCTTQPGGVWGCG